MTNESILIEENKKLKAEIEYLNEFIDRRDTKLEAYLTHNSQLMEENTRLKKQLERAKEGLMHIGSRTHMSNLEPTDPSLALSYLKDLEEMEG